MIIYRAKPLEIQLYILDPQICGSRTRTAVGSNSCSASVSSDHNQDGPHLKFQDRAGDLVNGHSENFGNLIVLVPAALVAAIHALG